MIKIVWSRNDTHFEYETTDIIGGDLSRVEPRYAHHLVYQIKNIIGGDLIRVEPRDTHLVDHTTNIIGGDLICVEPGRHPSFSPFHEHHRQRSNRVEPGDSYLVNRMNITGGDLIAWSRETIL